MLVWLLVSLSPCLLVFGTTGCQSNSDLVEAELRTRERELREAREELGKCRSYNQAMQREMHAIRGSASAKITPEQASQMYTLQKIVLGRQTGGYNSGDKPVDEALQVVIEPQDPDGHAIKAPGTLTVQAVEINAEGLKRPLATWYVTEDQMRRNWRSGLFTTGYFVVLPWQSWPTTDKLRVIAQFTLADGRQFEADKDVTVHLPPQHRAIPTNGSNFPEGIPLPNAHAAQG